MPKGETEQGAPHNGSISHNVNAMIMMMVHNFIF